MVFKIHKGYDPSSLGALLKYHEDKVIKKVAVKDELFTNTTAQTSNQVGTMFIEHMEMHNPRVYKNYFTQITANFDTTDQIDLITKRQIMDNYLTQMGYHNTPMISYHHKDKEHDHWHFICTASDFDGKLIDTRNDHHRSNIISREIEKAYNLKQLSSISENSSIKESSINAEKYKMYHAILRFKEATSSNHTLNRNTVTTLKTPIDKLEKYNKLNKPLTQSQINYFFRKQGISEDFQRLHTGLRELGFIQATGLEQIQLRAKETRNQATSLSDFVKLFPDEQKGFYIRNIRNTGELSIGIRKTKENGLRSPIYPKLERIGKEFTIKELEKYFEAKKNSLNYNPPKEKKFSFDDVKKFVKTSVQKVSAASFDWSQFKNSLKKKYDIDTIVKTRSDLSTHLSFIHKEFRVKSSEIGLSHSALSHKIDGNRNYSISIRKFKNQFYESEQSVAKSPKTELKFIPMKFSTLSHANQNSVHEAANNYFQSEQNNQLSGVLPNYIRQVLLDILNLRNVKCDSEIYDKYKKENQVKKYLEALKALAKIGYFESSTAQVRIQEFARNALINAKDEQSYLNNFNKNDLLFEAKKKKEDVNYRLLFNEYINHHKPLPNLNDVQRITQHYEEPTLAIIKKYTAQCLSTSQNINDLTNQLNKAFNLEIDFSHPKKIRIHPFDNTQRALVLNKKTVENRFEENRMFLSKLPLLKTKDQYFQQTGILPNSREIDFTKSALNLLFTLKTITNQDAFEAEIDIRKYQFKGLER